MANNGTRAALAAIETALANLNITYVDAPTIDIAVQGLIDARHILKQQLADEARG